MVGWRGFIDQHPVRPMPGDRVRIITGNGAGGWSFHHALFVFLGVVSLIELTINDRTAGAVDLLRSYSFTGERSGKVWVRHLRGDIDHVMI